MIFSSFWHPDSDSDSTLSFDFNAWMQLLNQQPFLTEHRLLFLKGLQDHPEWVHQQDRMKLTPFFRAVEAQRLDVLNDLIHAGSVIDCINFMGNTPLMRASHFGHLPIVRFLIEKGSPLNVQNEHGMTSLMKASKEGHHEVIRELLHAGADPGIPTHNGLTALMWAISNAHLEAVQALLDGHPDLRHHGGQQILLDFASLTQHHSSSALLVLKYLEAYVAQNHLLQSIHDTSSQPQSQPLQDSVTLNSKQGILPRRL